MNPTRQIFLASCAVVAQAVTDERVAAAWDKPSVLAEQTVGAVAAHVTRGSWVAYDYLDDGTPVGSATFVSAADYFAKLLDAATPDMHSGIRQRGADVATEGPEAAVDNLRAKIAELETRLNDEPADRLLHVYGGNVMGLDHYLETRILEQVVHLNDLARSIGIDPWPNAPGADDLVISIGVEIGRLRYGDNATIHALFRGIDENSSFASGVTA